MPIQHMPSNPKMEVQLMADSKLQCPHCPAKVKPKFYDSHVKGHNEVK